MHPSRTPIRSLVAIVKWLELRQSFYIWHKQPIGPLAKKYGFKDHGTKPRYMHYAWLQNMTIPTIRSLVQAGAIYKALSDKKLTGRTFEDAMNATLPEPKPARAPRPHWTQRLKAH